MTGADRGSFVSGLLTTSAGAFLSRLLGLARDIATASLLGMSGGVMDAFVIALRGPELFRRLFVEGALTAAFLPALTRELAADRRRGWRLASSLLVSLAGLLLLVVVLGELLCAVLWWRGEGGQLRLLAGLTAMLLPYLLLLCLTAQLAAVLHAVHHFAAPAMAPAIVNVFWLAAALLLAPALLYDKSAQAYLLAGCITAAGVAQFGLLWSVLRGYGFRFQQDWRSSRASVRRILWSASPAIIGLAVMQLNTLSDSLMAWSFSSTSDERMAWLAGAAYPMRLGAASAIYLGQRLLMFPQGLIGSAVATVFFPLLSRHAARGDQVRVGEDLTLGLRLVFMLGAPAAAGLVLLAEPITRLLFERGEFTPEDAERTATVIASYGVGVLAFCAAPLLVRGFYALNDQRTPLRVGLLAVLVNIVLNGCFLWWWAEPGLAAATSLSASLQCVCLLAAIATRVRLCWPALGATALRTAAATALMSLAVGAAAPRLPEPADLTSRLLAVSAPIVLALLVYFGFFAITGAPEWRALRGARQGDRSA